MLDTNVKADPPVETPHILPLTFLSYCFNPWLNMLAHALTLYSLAKQNSINEKIDCSRVAKLPFVDNACIARKQEAKLRHWTVDVLETCSAMSQIRVHSSNLSEEDRFG